MMMVTLTAVVTVVAMVIMVVVVTLVMVTLMVVMILMVMVTLVVAMVVVTPKQEETQTVRILPTFLSLERGRGLLYQPGGLTYAEGENRR